MKVLYLTKYSSKGASSRMRSFQYFPYLEKAAIQITVSSFFSDKYLEDLYIGKKSLSAVLSAYVKRFFVLFTVFRYDRIVIEYELFPYFPAWFEKIIKVIGVKYIVDYDDAIFHNYDLHPNKWLRKFFGKKIDDVMKYSSIVIAGNQYLANRAEVAGAKCIKIIPTVIDLDRYKAKSNYLSEKFTIGWIGSPSTYKYLLSISDELRSFALEYDVEVLVIGAVSEEKAEPPFRYIPWDKNTETEWIRTFDVGVMPLDETPWSKGKCSFKLIQYMACGVPVIASPVGMNEEVVTESNGFLVRTSADWNAFLFKYYESVELKEKHGKKGRQIVEQKYALQVTSNIWQQLLKEEDDN